MTAIADIFLEPIKQYAQSLKKQLDLPLSKAQELAAQIHNFASWHELTTVAKRNPCDERLRGAAVSHRSPPAVRTPAAVAVALQAEQRMAALMEYAEARCTETNRRARGLSLEDPLAPFFHLDFRGAKLAPGQASDNMDDRFRLNLFEPAPRFVAVWGATGWGKSGLGASIAMAQAGYGGNVCYLDPLIGESLKSQDWAGSMRNAMLCSEGGSQQVVDASGAIQPFTRITGLGCGAWGGPKPPLDVLLRNIADNLLPFSVLLIDEPAFIPTAGREDQIAHELDRIIASGSAVVWLSQDMPTSKTLPLCRQTQDNAVLLLGRTYAWTELPEDQAALMEIARQLPMERGKSACWIAAVATNQEEYEASILEVSCGDIEEQSKQFCAQPA